MERPRIVAKVKHLNKPNWIELYANGTYIGQTWGTATLDPRGKTGKYMLVVSHANKIGASAFFHIDDIEYIVDKKEAVESIEPELVKP